MRPNQFRRGWILALVVHAAALSAQRHSRHAPPQADRSDSLVRDAAAAIASQDVARDIGVLADDSMQGRNTPGRGLEMSARYIATFYRTLGLTPLGDSGDFVQRYPIPGATAEHEPASIEFTENGATYRFTVPADAIVQGPPTRLPISGLARLYAGPLHPANVSRDDIRGRLVLYLETDPLHGDPAIPESIASSAPRALVVIYPAGRRADARDSAWVAAAYRHRVPLIRTTDTLFSVLRYPPDVGALEARHAPLAMDLPPDISLQVTIPPAAALAHTAPNVVALIPGSDSTARRQYIVVSAHFDHIGTAGDGIGGCAAEGADSICNGADDNASGTAAVMAVADALHRAAGALRRSVILLDVSGEERGLFGSSWFAEHLPVPRESIVAEINLDMIGRNAPDTIYALGAEYSDLGRTVADVLAHHTELRLAPAPDRWPSEHYFRRSDQYPLARAGIPALFLFSGPHAQYHTPGDVAALVDNDKVSRVARLTFYLAVALSDAKAKPRWITTLDER